MKAMMIGVAFLALSLAGCSGDQGKELFDTAQLEERQNSNAHAIQLYEELRRKYPDGPYAQQAAERLAALKGSSK
jgi:outer membrane protein assembly factor BamD (BamD/ComL family)